MMRSRAHSSSRRDPFQPHRCIALAVLMAAACGGPAEDTEGAPASGGASPVGGASGSGGAVPGAMVTGGAPSGTGGAGTGDVVTGFGGIASSGAGSGGTSTTVSGTGGLATGGAAVGGAQMGGASTGGRLGSGGAATGEESGGNPAIGGAAAGGASTGGGTGGGASTGGAATGGVGTGGSTGSGFSTGGRSGGFSTGGRSGGFSTGGRTGGSGTGGVGAGGASSGGSDVGGADSGGGGGIGTGGAGTGGGDATEEITIWLAGDSTVDDGSTPCPVGWGKPFADEFNDLVTVVNSAIAGRSVRKWLYAVTSTMDASGECVVETDASGNPVLQSHWQNMLDGMQSGDYLFIQFGINDGSATCDRHVGLDAFRAEYGMMAEAARERGTSPVFVTPTSAIACSGSTAVGTRGEYVTATINAGAEFDVPVIDLHQLTVDLYNELGFCPVPGGDVSSSTTGAVGDFFCDDHTHFAETGAAVIAAVVADAVANLGLSLAAYRE